MPDFATASDLIDLVYQGALEPGRFQEFLGEAARSVGAPSGNVQAFDRDTGVCRFAAMSGPNYSEKVIQLYQSEFMHIETHRKFFSAEQLGTDTRVMLCHDFLSARDVSRDPYFQDFLIPNTGTRWLAGALSFDDPDQSIQFGFMRQADQTSFDESARVLLERLTPHLRRVVKVSIALARSQDVEAALGEAFGRHWAAIYLLNGAGRVVWMNAAAEESTRATGPAAFEAACSALCVKGDMLRGQDPESDLRLARAIKDAQGVIDRGDAGDFDMPDRLGRRVPVSVRPAGPLGAAVGGRGDASVIVLAGGHSPARATGQRLARIYALTAAEARLCLDLAEGLAIEDCARRREISPHTTRTQLKSIFSKTGTRRQAELVALVWRWSQV